MADRFLDSAGGNVAPYETTASAATTLSGLLAVENVAQGDIIWVKNDSIILESSSAAVVWTAENATPAAPMQIISASDWSAAPTAIQAGAIVAASGNYTFTVNGNFHFSGIFFKIGLTSPGQNSFVGIGSSVNGPHYQIYDNCEFWSPNISPSTIMSLGASGNASTDNTASIFNNAGLNLANVSGKISAVRGSHTFNNLYFASGSVAPLSLFTTVGSSDINIAINNSDLSLVSVVAIVTITAGFNGKFTFANCKFNAATTVAAGTWLAPGGEILLINCDSGDTYTRNERHGYEGIWSTTTTIYATTDPADMSEAAGDSYSIKMASSANVSRHLPLYSQWMQVWVDGTAYTPSVEVLVGADGAAALNSDELWVEVDYNSGPDSPLGSRLTTCPDIITAGTTVDAGTTVWTGDSYATERTHRLTVAAITPDKPGFINMRVALAKPSTIIYVNPPR